MVSHAKPLSLTILVLLVLGMVASIIIVPMIPTVAAVTPTLVQSSTGSNTSPSSLTVTFSSTVSSGDMLVLSFQAQVAPNNGLYPCVEPGPIPTVTWSVSDTLGSSWTNSKTANTCDMIGPYRGPLVSEEDYAFAGSSSADSLSVIFVCSGGCNAGKINMQIYELSGTTSLGPVASSACTIGSGSGSCTPLTVSGYTPTSGGIVIASGAYVCSVADCSGLNPAASFTEVPSGLACASQSLVGCSEYLTPWSSGSLSTLFTYTDGSGNSGGYSSQVAVTYLPPNGVVLPVTISLYTSGTTGNIGVSGCGANPTSIPGDGGTYDVAVAPSCTVTFTVPTPSGNNRWCFASGGDCVSTASVGSCASDTCFTYIKSYFYQDLESIYYSVTGGGTPTAPTLTYDYVSATDTLTLTTTSVAYWIDDATTWTVTNPLSPSSGIEQWATATDSYTATAGASQLVPYYHQLLQTISYSVTCIGSCPTPSISYTSFGVPASVAIPLYSSTSTIWSDIGTSAIAAPTIVDNLGNVYTPSPAVNSWIITTADQVASPIIYNFYTTIQAAPNIGSSIFDNADSYSANTGTSFSTGNFITPWSGYVSDDACYSANIVGYQSITGFPASLLPPSTKLSFPNGFGLISNANSGPCQTVPGFAETYIKVNTTNNNVLVGKFNLLTIAPVTISGTYIFSIYYTTSSPSVLGTLIGSYTVGSGVSSVQNITLAITTSPNQILYIQFALSTDPTSVATDGCGFAGFSTATCAIIDNIFIDGAGAYILPHNLNILWAPSGVWYNTTAYHPFSVSVTYLSGSSIIDQFLSPISSPDRNEIFSNAYLVTVSVGPNGYFMTFIPSTGSGNRTIYLFNPNLVHQFAMQIQDQTGDFQAGSRFYISLGHTPITSGYTDGTNSFIAWLVPGNYNIKVVSGANSYSTTFNALSTESSINIPILLVKTSNPSSPSSSVTWAAAWNLNTNNTVQAEYSDTTNTTTAITFVMYAMNQTCAAPSYCVISSVVAPPGSYGLVVVQLHGVYRDALDYFVVLTAINTFGTNTYNIAVSAQSNFGNIGNPPSLDSLGAGGYLPSWISILDVITFFAMVVTATAFTARNSWFAIIAIGLEAAFFALGGWSNIAPAFASIIVATGVIGYIVQKERHA